jgi:hypothetical protein
VLGDGFADPVADREDRVECGHRLLKNHCDMTAADLSEPTRRDGTQILAADRDPAVDLTILGQQAHQSA